MSAAVRTSDTHPLRIDFVTSDQFAGRIGMTFCPGKKQPHAMTGAWNRDLEQDIRRIVACGATHVVTLMETHELAALGVENVGECVDAAGLEWYHLPVADGAKPDRRFAERWEGTGRDLRWALLDGETVVIHCKGGLGRTGTLAAQILMEFGEESGAAISRVRSARPGAIETAVQQRYLAQYRPPETEPSKMTARFVVIQLNSERLREKRLEEIGFPVPRDVFNEMMAAGGLQYGITTGMLLAWMQEFTGHDHHGWRAYQRSLERLVKRIAADESAESVVFEDSGHWVQCTKVALDREIVTIQRQGNVLAALASTPEGCLNVMALHYLDAKSLGYIIASSIRPHPQHGVSMRENNWEYLKDCSVGTGNIYAADCGEAYLSYWRRGLGRCDDGRLFLRWARQGEYQAILPALTATQLSVHTRFQDSIS